MPPKLRKRKAPLPLPSPPSSECSSSDEEYWVTKAERTLPTLPYKYKCPVGGCRKKFQVTTALRDHYRSHTQIKPYKCSFPSCNQACSQLTHLIKHIHKTHKIRSRKEAKMYVEEHTELLAEESKELGINEYSTEKVYSEVVWENGDSSVSTLALPYFDTIHQTSTGQLICPFNGCNHHSENLAKVKVHYRVHGENDYLPYRCTFPGPCRYAANTKSLVEGHIKMKHIPPSNTTLIASDYVEARTDWLEMEDVLFSNAQIISPPEIQRPRPYACTICTKNLANFSALRKHLRTHSKSKPFRCSFPGCSHATSVKTSLKRHIYGVHFRVPKKELTNVSKEQKESAEQYVVVAQDEIENEETQIESLRICHKRKKQNCDITNNTVSDNENFDLERSSPFPSPSSSPLPSPAPSAEASSSLDDDDGDVLWEMKKSRPSRNLPYKYKCPECGKAFQMSSGLRVHYRSHTQMRPYKCSYPSCNETFVEQSHIFKHISKAHKKKSRNAAKIYVEELTEVLLEEGKQLGIKKMYTEKMYGEVICENGVAPVPSLPYFDTIHRTSTGHLICPFSGCDHQSNNLAKVRDHYRLHGGYNYRPFRCTYHSCRYAANTKGIVEGHVKWKHFPQNDIQLKLNASDFVEARADWLEIEDNLFSNAQIINPPEIQKPRPYACTICTMRLANFSALRKHLRTHSKSKPFRCSFLGCSHATSVKTSLTRHIYGVHFRVPKKELTNVSEEQKERAEQYVVVAQDEIENEETQIERARVRQKRKK